MNPPATRILLVDDDPLLLRVVQREIEKCCSTAIVVCALEIESALSQLRQGTFNLVLTDLEMKGDEAAGWTIVAEAKELGVPVVVLTGGDVEASVYEVPIHRKDRLGRRAISELLEKVIPVVQAA